VDCGWLLVYTVRGVLFVFGEQDFPGTSGKVCPEI
jgi:hypothetical protein